MVRVNANPQAEVSEGAQPRAPQLPPIEKRRQGINVGGRPHAQGTRLAKIMRERGIKAHDVGRVLLCSDRTVYNYLTRRYPIPALQLGALCDRLDMDPDELVDRDGLLLEEGV